MFNERGRPTLLVAALGTVLVAAAPGCAAPPEAPQAPTAVRVLSSNGVKSVVVLLQPDIERAIGRPLLIEFSTASSLKTKIETGEAFDVAILTPALVDDLIAQGRVAADSRADFARAGVGVGVRQGAPVADVSTPDALKNTLLNATSVVFTADGQSRNTIDLAFERLGIAEAMRPKTILKGPGEGPEVVAAGEAELVLTLVSEILPVPGLQFLGPLPDDLQAYVSFTAGRGIDSTESEAADALLEYLSGPTMAAALDAHGLEAAGANDTNR
jgi:molybdate transport system substrate-binding protein